MTRAALYAAGLAFALALFLPSALAAAEGPWIVEKIPPENVLETYGNPDEAISAEEACQLLVALINSARNDAGAKALELSSAATLLAQGHAVEMVENGYASHYNLAGLKCEQRYNQLGQTDHAAENLSYYRVNQRVYLTEKMVKRGFRHWMASATHRANLLDPAHTKVGCAFSMANWEDGTDIAAVAEFINEYGDYNKLPREVETGTTLHVSGFLDSSECLLEMVGIGLESPPQVREPEELNLLPASYSQPELELAFLPPHVSTASYDVSKNSSVFYNGRTGEFEVDIPINEHWAGKAIYVTVWATNPEIDDPFIAMTQVVMAD